MAPLIDSQLVKRFGAIIMMVNLAVAFFSLTDMYLLASGAVQIEPPEEDSFETTYDPLAMDFIFRSSYTISNNGFYDVDDLNIVSRLSTEEGELLVNYRSKDLKVPRWTTRTFPIEARLPLENLLKLDLAEMLFNSTKFVLEVDVEAAYVMGLVHFDMDQTKEFPWKAPLASYKEVLGDGKVEGIVQDMIGGNFEGATAKVSSALYGAFLASGGEVRVPLNGYTDLVVSLEDEVLLIRVELVRPFQMTVAHFELSLVDLGYKAPGPSEGEGGGVNEG